jgi:hypothetical protein
MDKSFYRCRLRGVRDFLSPRETRLDQGRLAEFRTERLYSYDPTCCVGAVEPNSPQWIELRIVCPHLAHFCRLARRTRVVSCPRY